MLSSNGVRLALGDDLPQSAIDSMLSVATEVTGLPLSPFHCLFPCLFPCLFHCLFPYFFPCPWECCAMLSFSSILISAAIEHRILLHRSALCCLYSCPLPRDCRRCMLCLSGGSAHAKKYHILSHHIASHYCHFDCSYHISTHLHSTPSLFSTPNQSTALHCTVACGC